MNWKIIGALSLVLLVACFAPAAIFAQAGNGSDIQPSPQTPPAYTGNDVVQLLPTIISWVFGFLIAIVVLMIIIAGYLFVTAGGNPEQVTKARNWLMYALIGLAIALLARGLVALVRMIIGSPGAAGA